MQPEPEPPTSSKDDTIANCPEKVKTNQKIQSFASSVESGDSKDDAQKSTGKQGMKAEHFNQVKCGSSDALESTKMNNKVPETLSRMSSSPSSSNGSTSSSQGGDNEEEEEDNDNDTSEIDNATTDVAQDLNSKDSGESMETGVNSTRRRHQRGGDAEKKSKKDRSKLRKGKWSVSQL